MTDGNTICVTGGTGSFGSAFARMLLASTPHKVRILSRDEHKQETLAREIPSSDRVTYILADIRDELALRQAFDGCWAVVHAAALKTVTMGERHAGEFAKTNVFGSQNVISAALSAGVRRSILVSSDKAVQSVNTYGATKRVAESLFVQANVLGVSRGCIFSVVRGGNVWNSAGSVATVWRQMLAESYSPVVNDPSVTRFNLLMSDWTAFVYRVLGSMWGGEIFAPIVPAWKLSDLALALTDHYTAAGPRPGDKQNECLVSADEAPRALNVGWAYVVEPPEALRQVWPYEPWAGERLTAAYTSDTARRMTMAELRDLWGQP